LHYELQVFELGFRPADEDLIMLVCPEYVPKMSREESRIGLPFSFPVYIQ